MGETICRSCGYMNWHIYAHRTGKCENCGEDIKWCDSCNVPIPKDGDEFGKWALQTIKKLKKNGIQK